MRIDTPTADFTSVGNGGTLYTVDTVSYDVISLVVQVASITGAPTNFTVTAYPETADGQSINGGNGLNTGAKTATGLYILDLWGTTSAQVSPVVENTFPRWRVVVTFTGGTSPTITGTLNMFLKHF
jgi:hypothetical protein